MSEPDLPEQDGWGVEMHGELVLFVNNAEKARGHGPGARVRVFREEKMRSAIAKERERADALQAERDELLTRLDLEAESCAHWKGQADALEAALKELDDATDEQANLTDGEWPFKAKARVKSAKATARALLEKLHD